MLSFIEKIKAKSSEVISHLQHIHKVGDETRHAVEVLLANEASLLHSNQRIIEILLEQNQEYQRTQTELLQTQTELLQQVQFMYKLLRPKKFGDPQSLDPDKALIAYLRPYLPSRKILDIGANVGDFAEPLLKEGYEIYAFEPFSPIFHQLQERLKDNPQFYAYEFAIGSHDDTMQLHLVTCLANANQYDDPSVYNSLKPHAMPDDLSFAGTVQVRVRSLESLHQSHEIPTDISLVKIDTEGYDLEVIRGMGNNKYPVVVTEFWDAQHVFQDSSSTKDTVLLKDVVNEMRQRDYHWYIVTSRDSDTAEVSFYCNYDRTPARAWGNTFFFQDYNLFTNALKWCAAVLPQTYLLR